MCADYGKQLANVKGYLGDYMIVSGIATRAEVRALVVALTELSEYKSLNHREQS
jgi:hypothetical protein